MDLSDLEAKRPPVTKVQLKARIRSLVGTKKAKAVAKKCVRGLWNVAKVVVKKKGAASGR